MSDQRIPSQWQLQNTGESLEQWMLHEEEQNLPSHMQLSQQQAQQGQNPYDAQYQAQYPGQYPPQYSQQDAAWQPIDYRAMQQAAQRPAKRSGAILGTLLVLALLGVGGYLAWFYAGQPQLPGLTPAPSEEQQAALPVETPAPAEETPETEAVAPVGEVPSPTPEPTVAPTSTPYLIEIGRVTVNSQFGLNARQSASADATAIQLLDNGASFLVANGPLAGADGTQWYEIVLPDNQRAFVSAEFVTPASEFIAYADAVTVLAAAGLPTPPAPAAEDDESLTATSPITDSAEITTTARTTSTNALAALTGTTAVSPVVTIEAPAVETSGVITASAVISAPAGVNLRGAPQTGENVLQMIVDATSLSVIGRSSDGQWLQVQLADGTRGWVSALFVLAAAAELDLIPLGTTQPLTATESLLPVLSPLPAQTEDVAAGTAVTTTAPLTSTTSVTTTAPTTGTTGGAGTGLGVLGLPTATPSAGATEPVTGTTASATPEAPAGVDATVISLSGANLRPEPSVDSVSTTALGWNTQHTATGRSADNAWVQITAADGATGWVSATSVMVMGGVGILPIVE